MKVQAVGLQASLVTSYDQTKTTLQGRTAQRTITDGNGAKSVVGPSPVVTADIFDDTGVAPVGLHCTTQNGRVFIGKGIAAGVWTVSYYTLNASTGALAWVGDLKFTMTNTGAYTLRGFAVDDTTPSAMNFHWFATNTTAIQGGWYASFGVPVADFHQVSVLTYPVATLGSTTKTVYQIGDTTTQAAQTVTVADGGDNDATNGFVYILNGAAATPKIFKFVNTVPTAAPVTGYSQANGTIVITATLPALAGVVLLVNCVKLGTIAHTANSGSLVLTWLTTTTIYNAKTSDVTNGATSLPSLLSGNMAGSADFLTPTAAFGQYSAFIDKFMIMGTIGQVIVKQGINNDPNSKIWGANSFIKSEIGGTITPGDFGAVTNLCLTDMEGWVVMTNTSVGQRNFLALDAFSDEASVATAASGGTLGQINSSIITPVLSGIFSKGVVMGLYYELSKRSVKPTLQYRTSGFATGPGVGFDATWTTVPKDGDLSALAGVTQAQFRFLFTMMALEVSNPPQLNETYFIYTDNTQTSDNWVGSLDNSTQSGNSPMYVAWRLQTAYASVVPKLFARGIDDSGSTIFTFDTVTNAAAFSYSTNNGTSWNALGTIPNTPLTTELRVNVASPSGTRLRWSLAET